MKVINCEQHDPTWMHERCGRVTASRIADVIGKLKSGKYGAGRENYMMEKLEEILTGRVAEHFVSAPMQFGIENEGLAREIYEQTQGVEVERIGMVIHPTIDRFSSSPDGLVGEEGLVEFKVPNTSTHLRYLMDGVVPEDYKPQMTAQMACTGRKWCDFVSFDPRLPDDFWLFVIRYERDEKAIAEMEAEVEKFITELNEMAAKLLKHKKEAGPGPVKAEIPEWVKP